MRRALAMFLVLAAPGVALAQTGGDMLNKAAKGAIDAVVPPSDASPDAAKAAETPPKAGDMVNNPPFAHWSQFAIGTSVTTKEVVTLPDNSTAEAVVTSKLVSKSKDKLTVETVVTAGGAGKQGGQDVRTERAHENTLPLSPPRFRESPTGTLLDSL